MGWEKGRQIGCGFVGLVLLLGLLLEMERGSSQKTASRASHHHPNHHIREQPPQPRPRPPKQPRRRSAHAPTASSSRSSPSAWRSSRSSTSSTTATTGCSSGTSRTCPGCTRSCGWSTSSASTSSTRRRSTSWRWVGAGRMVVRRGQLHGTRPPCNSSMQPTPPPCNQHHPHATRQVAAVDKPKLHMWETGIMRVTRHPQMVGQGLWCAAHCLWTGSSVVLAASAALMVHHLFGCWHGDRRLKVSAAGGLRCRAGLGWAGAFEGNAAASSHELPHATSMQANTPPCARSWPHATPPRRRPSTETPLTRSRPAPAWCPFRRSGKEGRSCRMTTTRSSCGGPTPPSPPSRWAPTLRTR